MESDRPTPDPREFASTRALRDAAPTIRHADMLFDLLVNTLGELAMVEVAPTGDVHKLYRRTASGSDEVLPWPLMTLSFRAQQIIEMDMGLPPAPLPPPRDEVAPNLRNMRPGALTLHDGPHSIEVVYREDGLWKEMCRGGPPDTLAGLLMALGRAAATPVERVADYAAALDISRWGPGRLMYPATCPGGPLGVWAVGLRAVRRALHRRELPNEPSWVVADCFSGRALVAKGTREEALGAWRAEVERVRPKPPPPIDLDALKRKLDELEAQGEKVIGRETLDLPMQPWPEPTPPNVPAALLCFEPCPFPDHPWGPWVRTLGPHGESCFALWRARPDGFTLVGQDIVPHLDLEDLEARLDALDETRQPAPWEEGEAWRGEQKYACRAAFYRVLDRLTNKPGELAWDHEGSGHDFEAGSMNGAVIRSHVVRQQWLA